MSTSDRKDRSGIISNQSIGGGKLTNRLIDQGLLTKNMIDELRREWEDKTLQSGTRNKRGGAHRDDDNNFGNKPSK